LHDETEALALARPAVRARLADVLSANLGSDPPDDEEASRPVRHRVRIRIGRGRRIDVVAGLEADQPARERPLVEIRVAWEPRSVEAVPVRNAHDATDAGRAAAGNAAGSAAPGGRRLAEDEARREKRASAGE
jgi:hypothetical protein